jgi:hypothetical protein
MHDIHDGASGHAVFSPMDCLPPQVTVAAPEIVRKAVTEGLAGLLNQMEADQVCYYLRPPYSYT